MVTTAKSRGAVAPGKRQVNWRLRVNLLEKVAAEAKEKGFTDQHGRPKTPSFIEYVLQNRYYPDTPSRRSSR